jgi:arginyl-tRNA synthetase
VTTAADPSHASPPIRTRVIATLELAWDRAIAEGRLPAIDAAARPRIEVERPANADHGDLATNLAMKLARPYRMAPLAIAEALATSLAAMAATDPGSSPVASAAVAAPGFLNLHLTDNALETLVGSVLASPATWGRVASAPRTVNVEFVSANPTGPLHIGNARGAFIGDLLSRILEAGGQHVTREYYFNDSGGQIRNLGASVVALRKGEPLPEDGYRGDYVLELVAALPDEVWAAATRSVWSARGPRASCGPGSRPAWSV